MKVVWNERTIVGLGICAAVAAACIASGDGDYLWGLLALLIVF